MKELSYAEIYDPISDVTFLGSLSPVSGTWDGNLESTNIQNFDLRWELFQEGGQMVSVSAFYKTFEKWSDMHATGYNPNSKKLSSSRNYQKWKDTKSTRVSLLNEF